MRVDPRSLATAAIEESLAVHKGLLADDCIGRIADAAELICDSLAGGGKLVLFGNGGSASDASHLATELVCRFQRDRRGLPAISLCADDSAVTAIANDYGFERVFSRQVEALGVPGDAALAISTSGRSPNVLAAARTARAMGLVTIALTGPSGGELAALVDVCVRVPSDATARIQESHILIGHILCDLVERELS